MIENYVKATIMAFESRPTVKKFEENFSMVMTREVIVNSILSSF